MKKIMALGILGVVGASAVTAFGPGKGMFGGNEDVKAAIDANDYDAFIDAISEMDPDAADRISEEDFENIVERKEIHEDVREAVENNDYDAFVEALFDSDKEIPSEEQFDKMVERYNLHEQVKEAIEDNDYDAWVAAVSQMPHGSDIADLVSEDEFDELRELHEARENGDYETAKALAEEIGLPEKKGDCEHGDKKGPRGNQQGFGDREQRSERGNQGPRFAGF